MLLTLYRGLTDLAGPLVPLLLERRARRGKEDRARAPERLGIASRPRPPGPLVWLHGASVGEVASAQILIDRLRQRRPDATVLVTSGTVTAAQMLAARLPAQAFHQYVPVDRAAYVDRFLAHWQPDLVLWMEQELWPNLVRAIARAGVPAALVNARMSAGSFERWRRWPGMIRPLLQAFTIVLPWNEGEAERFGILGARRIGAAGNLKFSAEPLAADPTALAALKTAIAGRAVWLAASTHDGEEAICLAAHAEVAARLPGLLTIIAPRHPERGAAVATLGTGARRRSLGELPDAKTAIYVADTLGELGLFFRLAPVVLVGGSLLPHGGHNPIEPAQLGAAILYGPHMTNFSEATAVLEDAHAARVVGDARELAAAVEQLLRDPNAARRMGEAAAGVAAANRDVIDRVMAELGPLLDGLPRP